MTVEELDKLYDKVTSVINNYESYHVYYWCNNEYWYPNGEGVQFEVHGHSDQGSGADWCETWTISSNGAISSEDTRWDTFEQFEADWV